MAPWCYVNPWPRGPDCRLRLCGQTGGRKALRWAGRQVPAMPWGPQLRTDSIGSYLHCTYAIVVCFCELSLETNYDKVWACFFRIQCDGRRESDHILICIHLKTQWNSRRKSSCKKIREKQNINHYLLFFEKQQQQQQQQQQQRQQQQQQQQNTTTTNNNNTSNNNTNTNNNNNNICNISNIFNICNICNIRTKKGQPWSWVNIGPFKHKGAS